MLAEAIDPKTGKRVQLECAANSVDDIRDLLKFDLTEDALEARLNQLNVSADAKSLLFTIAKATPTVGRAVVRIGRKVVDIVLSLLEKFPMSTTGVVFAAAFGPLVSAIPIAGVVLGPLAAALAGATGFAFGAIQDFNNMAMGRRMKAALAEFEGLKAIEA